MEPERRMSTERTRCCESVVQEFKPDNIGLEYENPSHFVTPQVSLTTIDSKEDVIFNFWEQQHN